MDRYTFNLTGIDPWIKEGISVDALKKFNIKYDSTIKLFLTLTIMEILLERKILWKMLLQNICQ